MKRKGILSKREQELRAQERDLLDRLSEALDRFRPDISDEDLGLLADSREQLAGLFLLVIAGEFNSGKSSFINALLGEELLPHGVTPTTDRVNVIRYGPEPGEQLLEAHLLERVFPSELLREMNIVDTPGTNAILREHEELTRDFVPRSDLVLFVTSADRPFTESERQFLEQIREWGKKILFVINKIDILDDPADRKTVREFVSTNAAELLGQEPEVFALSARQALEARASDDQTLWEASGFEGIETYLLETLDQEERVRLKLLNPLNIGLRLATQYKQVAFDRLKLLSEDIETVANIDRQLALYHEEMLRDFEPRLSRLDVRLAELESRGHAFFDETIRIGRIRSLVDSESIRRAFEHEVIKETPQEIEREVGEIIDWIVERNLRTWEDVRGYIDRRQIERHRDELIGEVGQTFTYNRQALLGSIGTVAKETVGTYDRETEARAIANDVQGAFATTAALEVGALGLGTAVATILTGAAADVTGLLLATVLAVGGFYLLPRKRRQAKSDFKARIDELRKELKSALTRQVHRAIEGSTEQINQAIAPYRRFVTTKQEQVTEAREELVATEHALTRLKGEINKTLE
ncbi:MAG: dynamin family protein [Longimicrobiales bacterium]